MSKPEWEEFGEPIGTPSGESRWFSRAPNIAEQPMVPIQERWLCPVEGCEGEMVYNGLTWPTASPGYHHTCTQCRFTAAVRGVHYPKISYRPCQEPSE